MSKSETENTVWTSSEKKMYKSPPGVGGWFTGGLDFPGLLNGEVFLFF